MMATAVLQRAVSELLSFVGERVVITPRQKVATHTYDKHLH
jgi:hypothetical protein